MKEGILNTRYDGRYELLDAEGVDLTYFTSGSIIELYVDDYGWVPGRVEYSDNYGGYYFYNETGRHRRLCEGLKVRCK